jgi:hypothetical protein
MDHANNDNAKTATVHLGSCHCGAIRFEVTADLSGGATRCNCTVCTKLGGLGIIVAPEAVRSLTPEAELASYEWGGKVAKRYFCRTCGIHTFSRGFLPQLGGAFASVNVDTLDDVDPAQLKVGYWDGRHDNWMAGLRDTPWPIFSAAA